MTKTSVSRSFLGAALAAMLAFSVGAASCSDDTTNLLTGDNCQEACDRYRICYDPAFDSGACTTRCLNSVNNSTITAQTTDDCLNCIGASSCGAATYNCSGTCSLVLTIP